jgi:hypothetical protein
MVHEKGLHPERMEPPDEFFLGLVELTPLYTCDKSCESLSINFEDRAVRMLAIADGDCSVFSNADLHAVCAGSSAV